MDFSAHIFVFRVLHGFVFVSERIQIVIPTVFIGSDQRDAFCLRLCERSG
jgi:hypothetical protein